jgi:hypothetical protein
MAWAADAWTSAAGAGMTAHPFSCTRAHVARISAGTSRFASSREGARARCRARPGIRFTLLDAALTLLNV